GVRAARARLVARASAAARPGSRPLVAGPPLLRGRRHRQRLLEPRQHRQVASRVLHGVGLELTPPFLPRLRITGEVRNAGDDRTADVFGFPLPGRSFFVTVSYGFGRSDGG